MKYICRSLFPFSLLLCGFNPPVCGQTVAKFEPEEVGLSSTRLERINKLMQNYVHEKKLSGIVTLVARRDKVVHFERFGMMRIEENKQMQLNTIFRIHSMTKPITSVAVMMLYEEGHFQLYDPVSKFIPEFEGLKVVEDATEQGLELSDPEREMTIRDLLIHTSGLTYGDGDTPVDVMYREGGVLEYRPKKSGEFCIMPGDGRTLKGMIQKLSKIPLLFHPGEQWHYGVSTDVLGHLVEVVSGMPLDRFFEERIFEPLGMVDTGFYVPEEKIRSFAASYSPGGSGGISIIDPPTTSPFSSPTSFFAGGGGLVSTASDYYRFAQMLLNGGHLNGTRLLGRKTVELMTVNHLWWGEYTKGFGFGLGFWVIEDIGRSQEIGSEGSFGWGGAANTWFLIDPREKLIAIFMTQLVPYGHYPVIKQFKTLAYQAIVD